MKERPILFNAEMVRAVLDGRKTQTRRVMKPQPDDDARITIGEIGTSLGVAYIGNERSGGIATRVPCPYGQPGDRLWVRERHSFNDSMKSASPGCWLVDVEYSDGTEQNILAEIKKPKLTRERGETGWRPSIFMPRWASRITLEITGIRVERVQDISEEDVHAEGCDIMTTGQAHAQAWFHKLWDSINAKRGYGWNDNPWVWVNEFKRETP